MNAPRLRRDQQVERNRGQLLAAARRVFLERGFHAATLDAIAAAAGFSKGVVYSQFDSKADLFLALLDRRIEERAAESERIAAGGGGDGGILDLLLAAQRASAADPEWNLVVLEFRVHAARDRALNRRYAIAHARTVARLASALRSASTRVARTASLPAETMATFVLAFAAGIALEQLATAAPLPDDDLRAMVGRALGGAGAPAAGARRGPRRPPASRRPRSTAGPTRRRP